MTMSRVGRARDRQAQVAIAAACAALVACVVAGWFIWQHTGLRRYTLDIVTAAEPLPFVRLGDLGRLFPDTVQEMTLEQAVGPGVRPGPGLSVVLLAELRRLAAGDLVLAGYASDDGALPAPPDEASIASSA